MRATRTLWWNRERVFSGSQLAESKRFRIRKRSSKVRISRTKFYSVTNSNSRSEIPICSRRGDEEAVPSAGLSWSIFGERDALFEFSSSNFRRSSNFDDRRPIRAAASHPCHPILQLNVGIMIRTIINKFIKPCSPFRAVKRLNLICLFFIPSGCVTSTSAEQVWLSTIAEHCSQKGMQDACWDRS